MVNRASMQYSMKNGKWSTGRSGHTLKKYSNFNFVDHWKFFFSKKIIIILINNENFLSVQKKIRNDIITNFTWRVISHLIFRIFEYDFIWSLFKYRLKLPKEYHNTFDLLFFSHNQNTLWMKILLKKLFKNRLHWISSVMIFHMILPSFLHDQYKTSRSI